MTTKQVNRRCSQVEAEYKPELDTTGVPTMEAAGLAHIKQLELDGKAKSYTKGRRGCLRLYVIPEFGDWPVTKPKVKDIKRWKRRMQEAEKGADTITSAMWLFSGIFKYAMGEEWRTDNPIASVEKPKSDKPHPIVHMTPAEVNRLIAHVPDDDWGKVERVLYRAGQKTGLRRSELLALRWTDCDFPMEVFRIKEGYVEQEFKETKGRKEALLTFPWVTER